MNKEIKLVALDLDGTLLDSDKKISEYTKKTLEQAIAQGCEVVVASGRPITAIPKELLEFPGVRYVITANGARLLDLKTKNSLYENLLSVEIAAKALDVLMQYQDLYEIIVDGVGYVHADRLLCIDEYYQDVAMRAYMLETRIPVADVKEELYRQNKPVDKVQGIFSNMDEKREAEQKLKKIQGLEVSASFGHNHEINAAGTSKGTCLIKLGEILGITMDEMMACGDGMNDYEMLRTVGFAVVMGNGHKDLKAIADYVTDTNNEDGVAKAIEQFVLK